ncbi:MAG TPA: serine protease [Zoogloea sp.]|uniref:S1C family serine protease n=1 Tax=Zoogloea sp. TaxID=49181 RepID=UPI002C722028|nr:serine protease [Zoogloea sp.]HMV18483.1 serine protease [Rhodocyclaceae bacterium]HMV64488.1 serine protease [Rhodocyclaceae bacterium]HMW52647.1 serine protease [Rhodocyclaceae bacterium]HMY48176.1 serine protease [Rhodocyclaceae bacterium]HMZ74808.1 serine protease [Rhodocyclaceae bacterium]
MAGLAQRRRVLAGLGALATTWAMPTWADFPDVVAQIKNGVVAVGTFLPSRNPQFKFRGTGFVVGNGNLVATNIHVVSDALEENETLTVALPGTGRVIGRAVVRQASDADHDLVLLRFDGPPLPALRLGDSGAVRDGQEVAITGFPLGASLGLVPVTHRGIVSAVTPVGMPAPSASQLDARTVRRLAMGAYNVFQLDLVSYPGNSGSPLFDTHSGEVVGILNMVFVKGTKESAVAMPTGISYAIPTHYLKALLVP